MIWKFHCPHNCLEKFERERDTEREGEGEREGGRGREREGERDPFPAVGAATNKTKLSS